MGDIKHSLGDPFQAENSINFKFECDLKNGLSKNS